jgi:amino-acid N-acetyltransferase
MEFESAVPGDEPQVRQLLAGCELPDEDITASHLQHFLVVRHEKNLAGVIGLELLGQCALLRSLAVEAHVRGQGIATRLVEKVEEYARSHDVESLYLLTTTAAGFFGKHGYRTTDRNNVPTVLKETAEFKNICPTTAICMVKTLKEAE